MMNTQLVANCESSGFSNVPCITQTRSLTQGYNRVLPGSIQLPEPQDHIFSSCSPLLQSWQTFQFLKTSQKYYSQQPYSQPRFIQLQQIKYRPCQGRNGKTKNRREIRHVICLINLQHESKRKLKI